MTEVDGLRQELRYALASTEAWLGAEPPLDLGNAAPDREWLGRAVQTVRQLSVRAASSLINVAFVGGYSSGKSFLISGLQGRLEYEEVENDEEVISERYLGLLFSAPQETTACPATVVPVDETADVDGSGRGFMRVRFVDDDKWEDIGNSPVPAVVAAYTTDDDEMVVNRLSPRHRERAVAEVEILLTHTALPAKLYDLPGFGALKPMHEQIATRAWADADCFVFTTQATQTIGQREHELISRLYEHHTNTGKRIIWVVTGIDRANVARNLDDNKLAWQETVERNNAYLRETYRVPGNPVDTFFGPHGFIGVSPAWEAQGNWLTRDGNGSPARGAKRVSASRMWHLREILEDLIESGAGRRHIALVAREARTMVSTRLGLLMELLDTAKKPLEQLDGERRTLDQRQSQLQRTIPDMRDQLKTDLDRHVRKVERQFSGLKDFLHEKLDDEIKQADLTKEREASRIEALRTQLLKDWAANHGPERVWSQESLSFMDTAVAAVRNILRETQPVEDFDGINARVDNEQLKIPASERYRTGAQDTMEQISKVVGISTPVLAGIAAAAGLISGPFLAVPAGLTLMAGLVYGGLRRRQGRVTALDHLRQAWISGLDDATKAFEGVFVLAAGSRGQDIIDRAAEILSVRGTEISRKIALIDQAIAAPDNSSRKQLVAELEPHCREASRILAKLHDLATP